MMKTKRKQISVLTRFRVFARDGFRCSYCGLTVFTNIPKHHYRHAVVDHQVSLWLGGTNDVSNLVTSCLKCNSIKGRSWKPTVCKTASISDVGEALVKENNMPSYKETYSSKSDFLKVEDLQKKRVALTILNCEPKAIGEDKKLVLSFHESEKQLVLNVTNARMLEMLTDSDNTDDWVDVKIILRPDITSYNGKPTPCIRIDSELPEQKSIPAGRGEQVPDNSIPF